MFFILLMQVRNTSEAALQRELPEVRDTARKT